MDGGKLLDLLITGLIPWSFFNDKSWRGNYYYISRNAGIIKKSVFPRVILRFQRWQADLVNFFISCIS